MLRKLGELLSQAFRGEDVVGRWGGEEFFVIAPSTPLEGAAVLGETYRAAVAASPVALPEGGTLDVTVSIGAAAAAGGFDVDALLRVADAALYEAKAAGRNAVVSASADDA